MKQYKHIEKRLKRLTPNPPPEEVVYVCFWGDGTFAGSSDGKVYEDDGVYLARWGEDSPTFV